MVVASLHVQTMGNWILSSSFVRGAAETRVPPRNGSCYITTRNAHGLQFLTVAVSYYTVSYAIDVAEVL